MKKIDVLILIILFFLSCAMLRSFFRPGIFTAHDVENHLARIANFASAIKAGQWPVRWAGNLNHKFGYPVFNFNYPLPNLLALPVMLVGFDIQTSLKVVLWLAYFSSGLFFYLWIKRYLKPIPALTGAVFYLTFPYQLIDIFIRGVVGENLTLALLPAVLYLTDRMIEKQTRSNYLLLTLAAAAFSLSHNGYVMLFAPLILLYLLYRNRKKSVLAGWLAVANGFLLTGFFWIPAWFEKKYVNLNAFDPATFYRDHFLTLRQLLDGRWRFGFSGNPDAPMTLALGWPLVIVIVIAIGLLARKWSKQRELDIRHSSFVIQAGLIICLLGLIFMITPYSHFLWKIVPFLGYLQFPWRLLGLVGFLGACLTGIMAVGWVRWVNYAAIVILAVYAWRFTFPFGWEQKHDNYFFEFPFTTTTRHENTPIWFSEENITKLETSEKVIGSQSQPTYSVIQWKPSRHQYQVENSQSQLVWERTAYFPGWHVVVDGVREPIVYDSPDYPGLIGYRLGPGTHTVITKFTENTPARIIGDSLSVMALAGLMAILVLIKRKKQLKKVR